MLVMKANDTGVAAVFPSGFAASRAFSEALLTNPIIANFPSTYTVLTFPLKPVRLMNLRMQVSLKLSGATEWLHGSFALRTGTE